MPHIALPENVPGILSLFAFRPETAQPLCALAEQLLRAPSSLAPGDRELIASYVSHLNACRFCTQSHSAFAAEWAGGDATVVEQVKANPETAPISAKLKALLNVARKVQQGGKSVLEADVRRAREAGASDVEIHDAVLIAAAFCMYNRYVDGLASWAPDAPDAYKSNAERIVKHGYLSARP